MVQYTRESGLMANNIGGGKYFQMGIGILEILLMVKSTDKDVLNGKLYIYIYIYCYLVQMVQSTRELGLRIKNMEKGEKHLLMGIAILEIYLMGTSTDKEFMNGKLYIYIYIYLYIAI